VTVFGALPVYRRVAEQSPHGEGSLAMLEHLLPRWRGKLVVLCLLGFLATDFIITITLSAADAAAHTAENPWAPAVLHHRLGLTLLLVAFIGALFVRGFHEAIGLAVILVAVYLALNLVTIVAGLAALVRQRFPSYTPSQIVDYLKLNAQPVGVSPNNTWGYGLAKLPSLPPGAPTNVSAVAGDASARMS